MPRKGNRFNGLQSCTAQDFLYNGYWVGHVVRPLGHQPQSFIKIKEFYHDTS